MKKLNQMRMANDQQLKQIHGTDYAYTETVVIPAWCASQESICG